MRRISKAAGRLPNGPPWRNLGCLNYRANAWTLTRRAFIVFSIAGSGVLPDGGVDWETPNRVSGKCVCQKSQSIVDTLKSAWRTPKQRLGGDRRAWLILGGRWQQLASEAEGRQQPAVPPAGMTTDKWEVDMKTCPDCNGDGVIEKGTDDEQQCPTCGGSGSVPDDNNEGNNEEVTRT
jgi:hypothetical protein